MQRRNSRLMKSRGGHRRERIAIIKIPRRRGRLPDGIMPGTMASAKKGKRYHHPRVLNTRARVARKNLRHSNPVS